MNIALAAAIQISLQDFSNEELAAFNIAAQISGRIALANIASPKALAKELVNAAGSLIDPQETKAASAQEILKRHQEGRWD